MSPSAKIVCVLSLIAAAGLILCALLIYGSLDRSRVVVAESNLNFVLNQLRSSIEANVNLGLPLADIRVTQNLIEQARANDSEILAVEIFSRAGISLFNTDRGSIGEPVRDTWRDAVRRSNGGNRWAIEEFGDIVVGEVIRNDFGEPLGYIAITVDGDARDAYAAAITSALARRLMIALPLALLVVAGISALIIAGAGANLRKAAQRLSPSPATTETAASAPRPAAGEDDLASLADAAGVSIARQVSHLDQTAQAILALDEDTQANASI
ncbi:hypothetical protein [Rhodoligotrophos ferricapiens]|uniref:hypothetical protein n=1 Tax=Rhodoligotrophos ferricapiens TaxID=3069264 RepID=UPI00315DC031